MALKALASLPKASAMFGVAAAGVVLVLEVAFRLAGLSVATTPERAPDGSAVVLCVGDSHTAGPPDPDNYPVRLEQLLNERTDERYRVINVGVPGLNTAQVRKRLERWVAYYRPAVVLHWAGINNYYNTAETGILHRGPLRRIVEGSRIVRFVRVALFYKQLGGKTLEVTREIVGLGGPDPHRRLRAAGIEEEFRRRPETRPAAERALSGLGADLTAMMRTTRELGVPLYFITYPGWTGKWMPLNATIQQVATEFGMPVISGGAALRAATREAPGPYFDTWAHPTPLVYRHVAEEAYRTLVYEGIVRPRAEGRAESSR